MSLLPIFCGLYGSDRAKPRKFHDLEFFFYIWDPAVKTSGFKMFLFPLFHDHFSPSLQPVENRKKKVSIFVGNVFPLLFGLTKCIKTII